MIGIAMCIHTTHNKNVIVVHQNPNKSVSGESLHPNFMPRFFGTGAFFVLWRMAVFRNSPL